MTKGFQLIQMIMQETGSYNDLGYRPYVPNTQENTLSILQQATNGGDNTSAEAILGVAGQILRPAAQAVGTALIQNGWGTRRFRFLMRVALGNRFQAMGSQEAVISGYSDYTGANPGTLSIDPNMRLYFNNVVLLNATNVTDPNIGVTQMIRMIDNAQIITGEHAPVVINSQLTSVGAVSMRPEDVYQEMRSSFYTGQNVINDSSTFSAGIKRSNRANNNPAQYLSKILTAHASVMNTNNEDDYHRALRAAQGMVRENPLSNNLFIHELQRETEIMRTGSVTWGELTHMNPHIDTVTRINFLKPDAIAMSDYTANSARMLGASPECVTATIVANTIPGIMMDCMMVSAAFQVTNRTVTGDVVVQMAGAGSFVQNMDISNMVGRFKHEVALYVDRELTMGRARFIDMTVQANAIGDTSVSVSIDGCPAVPYVIPSFCDAVIAPVVTQGLDALKTLSMDINTLANNISTYSGVENGYNSFI